MVVGEEAGLHGFRQAIQWLTALFYVNDGLLASPKLDRLQAAMYVLTGLLNRVGHQTNVEKSCDDVTYLLHCWRSSGDGAHAEDDMSGAMFSGETSGESLVSGLQGGAGGGVSVCLL